MQKLRLATALIGVSAAATGSTLYLIPGAGESPVSDSASDQQVVPGEESTADNLDAASTGPEPHQTYFQAQASLSDSYPSLPGNFGTSPSSGDSMPNAIAPPTLPPASATALPSANSGSLSSQSMSGSPAPRPVVRPETLPSYASSANTPPTLPPQSYPATSRSSQPTMGGPSSVGVPSGYASPTTAGQTYPSGSVLPESSSVGAPTLPSSGAVNSSMAAARGNTSVPGQMVGYQQPPRNAADGNALRSIDGRPPTQAGVYPPEQIATGLPYVTPAPKGTYATRPYNHALFQTAEFQRTAQQPNGFASQAQAGPGQLASTQARTQVAVPQYAAPQYVQPPGVSNVQGAPVASSSNPTATGPYDQPTYATASHAQNAGMKPVVSFGQEKNPVVMGQGIVGQPTAYVPGQPIRNFFRYIFP